MNQVQVNTVANLVEKLSSGQQKLFKVLLSDLITTFEGIDKEIVFEALNAMQPADTIELMLCIQVLSLHVIGMDLLQKKSSFDSEKKLNSAVKLLRLHSEKLESLQRYRRKGEQRVVVQHVSIEDGGKAIIGNVGVGAS